MLLHYGFETPTPEIMAAWGSWFESIADAQVAQGNPFIDSIRIYELRSM